MAKMAMLRTCAVVLCIAAAAAMPGTGFEPALSITQLGPQPSASANSAIRAGSHQLTMDSCQLPIANYQLSIVKVILLRRRCQGPEPGWVEKKAAPSMILCSPERSRGADCGSACRRQVADFPSAGSVFRVKSRSSELACRRQIPARLPGEALAKPGLDRLPRRLPAVSSVEPRRRRQHVRHPHAGRNRT